tara:strand:+ start:590 stop:820 length:231 start_codon:yes stop_codon:yes gene_type:complete
MNNLKTETKIIKSFVIDPKKEYARTYYMKNKVEKVEYYNAYYKKNRVNVLDKLNSNKSRLPQQFERERKQVIIKFN